jgi:hypothetical protein
VENATLYTYGSFSIQLIETDKIWNHRSWMIIAFGFNLAKSPIQTIFINSHGVAAGLTFMLLNVRVGLSWAVTHSPTWRDLLQESQFRAAGGELRFELTQETPALTTTNPVLSLKLNSTTEQVNESSTSTV